MSSVSNIGSTLRGQTYDKNGKSDEEAEAAVWRERSRIVLNPVASPSAMGLFAFSAATLIVAGNLAGWYGKAHLLARPWRHVEATGAGQARVRVHLCS